MSETLTKCVYLSIRQPLTICIQWSAAHIKACIHYFRWLISILIDSRRQNSYILCEHHERPGRKSKLESTHLLLDGRTHELLWWFFHKIKSNPLAKHNGTVERFKLCVAGDAREKRYSVDEALVFIIFLPGSPLLNYHN